VSFLAFTFITDDLVLPDGATCLGAVGGGGPQTAWGWALGCALLGVEDGAAPAAVAAGVGADDLDPAAQAWLASSLGPAGCAGLVAWPPPAPTPRAWQVLEADGRRTQVWRTPASASRTRMLLPGPRSLPPGLLGGVRAAHAGVDPASRRDLAWAAAVRAAAPPGAWLSLETYAEAASPPPPACLESLLGAASAFSPNAPELASLVGGGAAAGSVGGAVASARRLLSLAPPSSPVAGILVRCGAGGAVWVPRRPGSDGPALAVPAAPVTVADTTGCGNAFVGAWTAARVAGGADAGTALAVGAAVAAATAEVVGPPPAVTPAVLAAARERVAWVRGRVEERWESGRH